MAIFELSEAPTLSLQTKFSRIERSYFMKGGVYCREYVITDRFRELVKAINGGEKMIMLLGPKGVGKSVALGALAAISTCPTFVYSIRASEGNLFCDYLDDFFSKHDPEGESPHRKKPKLDHFMVRLMSIEEKLVILIDLSHLTSAEKDMQGSLSDVLSHVLSQDDIIVVLAHSSGMGTYISEQRSLTPTFQDLLSTYSGVSTKKIFVPFSDKEANVYWNLETRILVLKDLKALTNYNPLLLSVCQKDTSLSDAQATVFRVARSHCADVCKSLQSSGVIWDPTNLQMCLDMLYCAVNDFSIPETQLVLYKTCWLSMEGITYISDDTSTEFFIKVNFPSMVQILMKYLRDLDAKEGSYNNIMREFRFQHEVLQKCTKFCLTYNSTERHTMRVPVAMAVTFIVTTIITATTALDRIAVGTLVELRDGHPVIDAVARLKMNDSEWLLLIQVSLSTYAEHKSKVGDLQKKVTGPEAAFISQRSEHVREEYSWLQYYKEFCEEGVKCMYVYISPKECDGNPATILEEAGICSQTGDLHLGLVTKDSDTYQYIVETKSLLP